MRTKTNKRILLINPCPEGSVGINEATVYPPLGLAYLASYLRKNAPLHSYTVKIIDANILQINNKRMLEIIENLSPDIVGIHLNIVLAKSGIELAKHIKRKYPEITVCMGGPISSSKPRDVLLLSNADIAIIGEGEVTFLEICEGNELSKIKGIHYLRGKKVISNPPRPLIEDIDTIPPPAYELLPDFRKYKSRARKSPVGAIMSSRGCPYQCTYCNSSVFGKKFRAHSPEYILDEIDILINKYGVKQLDVLDDNFTLDIKRAEKILDMIIERNYNLLINLQNGVRADLLTENLVKKMKKAGVFKVGIGIESANKRTLKEIKKSLNLDKAAQSIRWFRKHHIMTIAFFVLGFPNDTKESIGQTIDFALKTNPSIANFTLLIPFPGTEIYDFMKSNNLLLHPNRFYYSTGFYDTKIYHKCFNLTNEQLASLQKEAYLKFNLRFFKILETLSNIRSFNELKWTLQAGIPILKNIIFSSKSKF